MKKTYISIFIVFILFLTSCASPNTDVESDKIQVFTSLFPQFDFVREIGQDKVDVTLLLSPGVEAHSFDPTPSQIISITQSDLFIYTNEEMEPWIDKIVENVKNESPLIVESSLGVEYIQGTYSHSHDEEDHNENENQNHDHEDDEKDHNEDETTSIDPHVWLDPINAKIMVLNILDALIEVDPDNRSFYQNNANDYLNKLDDLDEVFRSVFISTDNDTIVYGGHFAFGYLADRFDLTILSPYTGFSPDSEPTASAISELIQTIRDKNIKIIFYEELIDPKVARVISEQTNTEAMLLHGAHNLTPQEMENNVTYLEIMHTNAEKLRKALSYE